MRQFVKLSKLPLEDIVCLPQQYAPDVCIEVGEEGAEIKKLLCINELSKDYPLTIYVQLGNQTEKHRNNAVKGVDIFRYLPDVVRYELYAVSEAPIDSLLFLSQNKDIVSLSLEGTFSEKIDLGILNPYTLKHLRYLKGINNLQYKFLQRCEQLSSLEVRELDCNQLLCMDSLREVAVSRKLKAEEKLPSIIPNVQKLTLDMCKGISLENSIVPLSCLTNLSLRHIPGIKELPQLASHNTITHLTIVNLKELHNISIIESMPELRHLKITGLKKIKAEDLFFLETLKKLNSVYITFDSIRETTKIEDYIKQNNWFYGDYNLMK